MTDRRRQRIDLAVAHHQAAPPIVLSPSDQDRTDAVVAWAARLLARVRHSGGGSAP